MVDRSPVAELAGDCRAPCERAFELVLDAGKRPGESCAIYQIGILVASEAAPAWRWGPVELGAQ